MNRKFTSRLAENTFINREFASRPEKLNANTFMNRNSSWWISNVLREIYQQSMKRKVTSDTTPRVKASALASGVDSIWKGIEQIYF